MLFRDSLASYRARLDWLAWGGWAWLATPLGLGWLGLSWLGLNWLGLGLAGASAGWAKAWAAFRNLPNSIGHAVLEKI